MHFLRHIAPQIPTREKWNKIKKNTVLSSYIFENAEILCLKNKKTRFNV